MASEQTHSYGDPDDHRLPVGLLRYPLGARRLWLVIRQLERARGWCYASWAYLGDACGKSGRQAQRYVAEMIQDQLLLQAPRAKGATNKLRTQAVDNLAQARFVRVDKDVQTPGHVCPPRGGHTCPPNKIKYINSSVDIPGSGASDPNEEKGEESGKENREAAAPLFEPIEWDAWRACSGRCPAKTLWGAVKGQEVSQVKRSEEEGWQRISNAFLNRETNVVTLELIQDHRPGQNGGQVERVLISGQDILIAKWRA